MLAVITGLEAEARMARLLGPAFVGGGSRAGAEAAARRALASGATALISFGFAGGLNPEFSAGHLLVPEMIVDDAGRWRTDDALRAWLGDGSDRPLFGADAIVAGTDEKARLYRSSRCDAVDIESAVVARVAAEFAVPFAVLRAVSDPAHRAMPRVALEAVDGGGKVRAARVAASLARAPWQIPALLLLARDAGQARRALSDRVQTLSAAAQPFRGITPR